MSQKNSTIEKMSGRFVANIIVKETTYLLALLVLLFLASIQTASAQSPNAKVQFSFTINTAGTTSAGVFKRNGTLVRTLWNNVKYPAGTFSSSWDRRDDDGNLLTDTGYIVKVISNNVSYKWDGTIGNTSDSVNGHTRIKAFERIHAMTAFGNYMYFAIGYSEGTPSCYKFNINNPQQKINILAVDHASVDAESHFIATDGNYVYWTGFDAFNADLSFVYATKVSNDQEVIFSNGTQASMTFGRTYASAIDVIDNDKTAHPSGLAVMRSGNYLFVSHEGLNELRVLNKTTGALVQTISVTKPRELAMDMNDNLWMVSGTNTVEKYTINSNGTLSAAILSITGLQEPLAMAVSPNNSKILIADGGSSQQVKAFSNVNGSSVWTLGTSGGYATDPTVNNNKFYFNDGVTQLTKTYIAFQADSSFWVGDVGNERSQHYSANRTFIDRLMCLPHSYSTAVDKNNPTRVFNEYLEFQVDYSKPLLPNNGSWTLVKNWRHSIPAEYFQENMFNIFRQVVTLSNGKTYTFVEKVGDDIRTPELVEMPSSGNLRFTGIMLEPFANDILGQDGSLRRLVTSTNVGDSGYWEVQTLTGFSNNNPVWSAPSKVAYLPKIKSNDPANGNISWPTVTSTGINLVFNNRKENTGYHLAAVKNGTREYLWKTSPVTTTDYTGPMPKNGVFDIGNNVEYPGGHVYAMDRNVFWNYHGEFWKNSQTNIWNHFYDNGLMVGQFGITSLEGEALHKESFAMGAGNVFSSTLIKVGSEYFIYHNDECVQGAIHRWRISGLNTIAEQTINLQFNLGNSGGLMGSFFDGTDLNNVNLKINEVQTTVNLSSPPSQVTNASNFSARWSGFVKAGYNQNYTFYTNVSKGVRLWVSGKLVIDKWTNTTTTEFASTTVNMTSGKLYEIRMEINGGTATLSWSSSSQSKQIIPSTALFPSDAPDYSQGIDLMEGLCFRKVLENGLYGWSRTGATDKNISYDNYWNVYTNKKSFEKNCSDIYMRFRDYNSTGTVTRDLGTSASCQTSWKLSGKLNLENNFPNWNNSGAGYFDILDDQGKIITRITHEMTFISNTNKPTQIKINGKAIVNTNEKYLYSTINNTNEFEINVTSAGVTFKYANFSAVTAAIFDNTANWNKPKTIRFSFSGGDYDKAMGIQDFKFLAISSTVPTISTNKTPSFCQGDSVTLTASTASNYNWSTGAKTKSITVKNSGNYTVTTTDGSGCQSISKPTNVTVFALPVPVVTPGPSVQICQGDSVVLTTANYSTYLWNNSAKTKSITIKNNGTYQVKVTDNNGCSGTSNNVSVAVNALPSASISASGPLSFCQGKNVVLTATTANAYKWTNGATTQSITVNQSGNYGVTITDSKGCKGTSASSTVTVSNYPAPTITVSGLTEFCEGDSVILTSSPSTVYLWSNGATSQSITVNNSGNYTVNGGDGNGCSATSDPKEVTVNALPVPVITVNGNTLTVNYSTGIQWYLNGELIDGANKDTYEAKESGQYTVSVEDVNTCKGISEPFTHTVTKVGLSSDKLNNLMIYPNPSTGVFYITGTEQFKVEIYSVPGEKVYASENTGTIDIRHLAKGIYTLRVTTADGHYIQKIIVQ